MNKFFKNYNKYGQAVLWMEEAKAREVKKQALQATVEPQEEVTGTLAALSLQQPQVVFSRIDVGHSQEETSKIQKLYDDLKNLPLLPANALWL